jgi:hypothetical protein
MKLRKDLSDDWYYDNMTLEQLKTDMDNPNLLDYYRNRCKDWYYKKLEQNEYSRKS